jgi:hypothetical protein
MKDIVKYLTFEEHEINSICEAIILAQDNIGNKKCINSNHIWNSELDAKITALDAILKKIYTTEYRELPQPPESEIHLCNEVQQSLPFLDPQ